MHRLLVAALALVIFAMPAAGQEEEPARTTVAVIDFQADSRLLADSIFVSERLVQSLSNMVWYDVASRDEVRNKIAGTGKEGTKYFENPQEAVKLGSALGVQIVAAGRVSKVNSTYVLTVWTVDVSTGEILSKHRAEHTGTIRDALGLADILARKIAGIYNGPVITTESLPEGRVGIDYAQRLDVVARSLKKDEIAEWSCVDGTLPPGLKVESGVIIGTPEKPGKFVFTLSAAVQVPRLSGGVEKILAMRIKPAPLTLPDAQLPVARRGHAYSQEVLPPTGTPPFTWKVLEGALPSGLSFNESAGKIEGTPVSTGTFRVKVSVTDSIDPPETVAGWLTLEVTGRMKLLTAGLPTGYACCEYRAKLEVENGLAPLKVEVKPGSGGFDLSGSDEGLEIRGRVMLSAPNTRITVRVTDSTTPEPQAVNKVFPLNVKGFHVAPVTSYDSLELCDLAVDRGDNAIILAAMSIHGARSRWVSFCRWSGRDWSILPVTPEIKGGSYRLLANPEGPPVVIEFTGTGSSPRMVLKVFRPSRQEWVAEKVAVGRFHFPKERFNPAGELLFAYERDRKLWLLRKEGKTWKEELLLEGVVELTEFLYSPAGTAYFLYQDLSGQPMLLEKSELSSTVVKLPDYPRCAGMDGEGRLRLFSCWVDESVCYVREKDGFREAGRWKRPLSTGTVFSKRHLAAYSPPLPRGSEADTASLTISCVSPAYIFDTITFRQGELDAPLYDSQSLKLAVDRRGGVHAAFTVPGLGGKRKKTLVYGRITKMEEFRKVAKAKSFVRMTGQLELSMPKRGPGRSEKSGSCALAADASPFSLAAMLLLALLYRRRRHI